MLAREHAQSENAKTRTSYTPLLWQLPYSLNKQSRDSDLDLHVCDDDIIINVCVASTFPASVAGCCRLAAMPSLQVSPAVAGRRRRTDPIPGLVLRPECRTVAGPFGPPMPAPI